MSDSKTKTRAERRREEGEREIIFMHDGRRLVLVHRGDEPRKMELRKLGWAGKALLATVMRIKLMFRKFIT